MSGECKCPSCGERRFQELAYRQTWQPVTLDEDGEPDEYAEFDYGDDVWVIGVECRSCGSVWPTYDDLQKAMRGEAHDTGYLPEAEVFGPTPEASA